MIGEQVKELRELAKFEPLTSQWNMQGVVSALKQAADTIETLSAKLQAENIEQSVENCEKKPGKSVLMIDTPKGCFYCPFHKCPGFCQITSKNVLRTTADDSGVEDTCSQFPNWCPLEKLSAESCGGGWIPCSEQMPENSKVVLAYLSNNFMVTVVRKNGSWILYDEERISNVVAWRPLPEPYKQ